MSLKGDRYELDTDISFFMNETATRGLVVSVSTAGSGAAMDSAVALATVKANPSGAYPLGVLLNDMVNLDLTRQHLNQHKDEVQKGGKITILRKGFVTTDAISGTPAGGQDAYLAGTGLISATQAAGALKVGQFLSSKDADGFAKVSINL
jgi:hypothetical protein